MSSEYTLPPVPEWINLERKAAAESKRARKAAKRAARKGEGSDRGH